MRNVKTYPIDQRPDVEVEVDGAWHPGELRQWVQRDDGTWWADCSWSTAPGSRRLDSFEAERVRRV